MSNLMEAVMKKICLTILGLIFALVTNVNASKIKTVQSFFVVESDELVIRPLSTGDKSKTWKIEDTGETEKFVQMFHEDKSDAPEGAKISTIFRNQRSMLSRPWTILQDSESMKLIQPEHNHKLYLGVFEKKKASKRTMQELVGVINFSGFEKRGDFLWFEYMFDPNMRGKGYGTRTVQLMTDFLKENKIIATDPEETENFPYKGVKAIVDFENKASLVVILDKCQFQISGFEGCFVELVQPPQLDDAAHLVFKSKFDRYLKRPPIKEKVENSNPDEEEDEAEKKFTKAKKDHEKEQEIIRQELVEASFKRLAALSLENLQKLFCFNDYFFVVDALCDYPSLYEELEGEIKEYVREKITAYYDQEFKGKVASDPADRTQFNLRKKRFLSVIKKLEPKKIRRTTRKTNKDKGILEIR
jgi:RimJ/RimL family protein N-acetyltransferase